MMFQKIAVALALKALQAALCQIFGFCLDQDECPDGVCDEVLRDLDSLDEASPGVAMSPEATQALNFDIQWDRLGELTEATKAFVTALRAFLGLAAKVG